MTSGALSWRDIFKYKTDAPDLPRDGDDGGDGGDPDVSIPVETKPFLQANCGETTSLRRKLEKCAIETLREQIEQTRKRIDEMAAMHDEQIEQLLRQIEEKKNSI